MAIDFPNSPSSGDIHTVSGKQWSWDGEKWGAYGVSLSPSILKVDTGNNRVGINQVAPTVALDVTGSARITGDLTVSGTTVTVDSATVLIKDRVSFEGATADGYETVLLATDPTADRTITLPNATGTVTLDGAPLASPTFTGVPAAPTASASTNTTQVATTQFVMTEVGAVTTTSLTGSTNTWIPTITGANALTGTANFTYDGNTLDVKNSGTASSIKLYCETSNAHYQAIKAAPHSGSSNWTLTLPSTVPSVSGQALTATTSGVASWSSVLPLSGGTLTGAVNAGDQIISKAVFKDVGETLATNGTSGSTATIDLEDGNFHKVTLTANCTFTFSNPPASGTAGSFTLFLVQDGTGSRTVTWPTSVDWAAATAPTLTTTAAAVDVLTFITLDGGTIWNGFVAGQAMG